MLAKGYRRQIALGQIQGWHGAANPTYNGKASTALAPATQLLVLPGQASLGGKEHLLALSHQQLSASALMLVSCLLVGQSRTNKPYHRIITATLEFETSRCLPPIFILD